MQPSSIHALLALLAATASAQSTTTATVLVPDWCVTQATPTVTVVGQGDLTTYSYSCSYDTSAVSSASAKASQIRESARSKASSLRGDPRATDRPDNDNDDDNNNDRRRRSLNFFGRRDDSCYGWDAFEGCIPWEVTQGPSTWAVHYTATGIVALNQECSFGSGGVSSGDATCTASGRLDPSVWGNGDGPRTRTFAKSDVDRFWIRNTVAATAGGSAVATGSATTAATTAATVSGTNFVLLASQSAGAQSTGVAAPMAIPTGALAMAIGAGGILAAAIAL